MPKAAKRDAGKSLNHSEQEVRHAEDRNFRVRISPKFHGQKTSNPFGINEARGFRLRVYWAHSFTV